MNFQDIFKKSFLNNFSTEGIGTTDICIVMGITLLISLYLFAIYRILTRKEFYNKNFNMALPAVALITAAIIVTIQSSVVVSLGMVGALSIVRFRTAVKNPLDLVFMFWSISIGIICGAGIYELAIVVSVLITVVLFGLDMLPVAKAPMILVLQAQNTLKEEEMCQTLESCTSHYKIKSQSRSTSGARYIIELRMKRESGLMEQMGKLDGVEYLSLLDHDGEVTF